MFRGWFYLELKYLPASNVLFRQKPLYRAFKYVKYIRINLIYISIIYVVFLFKWNEKIWKFWIISFPLVA